MSYTSDLDRVVRDVLKSGRIGEPVFVRCTAGVEGDNAAHRRAIGRLAAAVSSWLNDPAERVWAVASPGSGSTSLMIEFRRGATALLATTSPGAAGLATDLVILGNRGAAYHEGLIARSGPFETTDEPRPSKPLHEAIERAIESGQPVAIGLEGAP